ncbi:hypothetical protein [Microbacterium rhizomatis]|uniref:Cupin n=1 Tax=Microbacterium rhizomatis TaxID=1631477 RepID=A0A5J5J2T0_9MICO|nr:hypothetical protein [Microbacterium rhizomatis]KAA9107713.1 hypothetical protein F6B43_09700 [Microbacterium rhizomatis]
MTSDRSTAATARAVRPPQFFEFSGELLAAHAAGTLSPGWTFSGEHSWIYRAQNFVVDITWLDKGQAEERISGPEEHALLVVDDVAVSVASGDEAAATLSGPVLAIVPPGPTHIECTRPGFIVRVYSCRDERIASRAHNDAAYVNPNPSVAPLPSEPTRPMSAGIRAYAMDDIPRDPDRFGRIFRTETLMINWFEPQIGPRSTDHLTPHSHDDFEQASVTMVGEFVHHVRRPWSERLSDWRSDEHVQVNSPSVTIIPPGNIHTTRAVGPGAHQLIDIFAPPRRDFIDRGWVLNQADYETLPTLSERTPS